MASFGFSRYLAPKASSERRHSASLVGVWAATEAVVSREVSEQPPTVTARMAATAAEAAKCAARVLSDIPPEIKR